MLPIVETTPRRRGVKVFFLPIIIILAGCIIAFSLYVVRIRDVVENGTGTPEAVLPVTPEDHIIGDPSASIVIVEYSDIDSSYGKKLELTMEQLMTEYAPGNKVAWVYRHFPVTTLRPNSAMHALAAECATSISQPTTFFRFIDAMNSLAPGDTIFSTKNYTAVVQQLGLSESAFEECLSAETFESKIRRDYTNALASGATESPYIVLIVEGKTPRAIHGAPPYKTLKGILDAEISAL